MNKIIKKVSKLFSKYIKFKSIIKVKQNIGLYLFIVFIRILFVAILLLKTEAFIKLLDVQYDKGRIPLIENSFFTMINYNTVKVHLYFILCLFSIGYLFKKKKQFIFYLVSDIVVSFIMVADLSYYRVNKGFLGLKNILYPGTFNVTDRNIINISKYDGIFVLDIIGLLLIGVIILIIRLIKKYYNRAINSNKAIFDETNNSLLDNEIAVDIQYKEIYTNNKFYNILNRIKKVFYSIINKPKRGIVRFALFMILPIIGISQNSINATTNEYTLCNGYFTKPCYGSDEAINTGVVGAHYIEAYDILKDIYKGCYVSDTQKQRIKKWFDYNKEELPDNEYRGVLKGKNVIIIQVESLENFVINKKTSGKEITPFLNKLSKNSLYFNNFYEQNNAASSIDCDFLVNTSLFPLGNHTITAIFYGQNTYANSLPRILEDEGYHTVSSHAEGTTDFNWSELHKNSFGVQKINDVNDFNIDEIIGYGLSDRSFYNQILDRIKSEDKPYFYQMATLASHGPFALDPKYRTLNLPKYIDNTVLGGYFESVNYADRQLEAFFNKLEQSGELDNTAVVVLGDHTSIHRNNNDMIQNIDYEGGWYKPNDYKIPLFIYAKGLKPQEITKAGGQVDILPTLLYMMGVDKEKYENTSMGRVLVNTEREGSIMRDGKVLGNPKDDEERNHLQEAYDVSEIIIRKNYFKVK